MGESDRGRERDLVLAPNEFAFISDETKGNINVYVGPHKTSLANTDRPVVFNNDSKRFDRCSLEQATQTLGVAPEGWYLVLKNPARDGSHPRTGALNNLPELNVGRKVNIPGPISFALWPGQMVRVIQGHHLHSNQYLVVRVYDEEGARANWKDAVFKPQRSGDGAPEPEEPVIRPDDLTMGKLMVIKGTEVAFHMPPTGIEVVPDAAGNYVREAVTLERLEYCILLDEDGNKRFIRGPAVVFPRPTEGFVERGGARKFRAIELSETSGIYVKVIAPYEEGGVAHKVGDELFITGKEQMIYFPRTEHAVIKYSDNETHHAIAIPAGEGRYVLDRRTGRISLKRGPAIYLPDPRHEVIVRRVLDPRSVALWFPGNADALAVNQQLATLKRSQTEGEHLVDREQQRLAAKVAPAQRADEKAASTFAGDDFTRSQNFARPRTLVLDTKYDGAVSIDVWTGYAVLVVSRTGERRVIAGPHTHLLEYDETLQPMELSTGTPKTDEKVARTVYLRALNNKVSDVVEAETRDLCRVQLTLSYRVNFEGDSARWFNVENYVKFLTDHLRSLLRHAVKQYGVEEFYSRAVTILRDVILGAQADGGKRAGRSFDENGMRVYDVEVLGVTLGDASIATMLVEAQHAAVEQTLTLAAEQRRLELARQTEDTRQKVAELQASTRLAELTVKLRELGRVRELQSAEVEAESALRRQRFEAQQAEQTLVDAIQHSELARKRAAAAVDLDVAKVKLDHELARIGAEVHALVEKAGAVSPDLIAALQSFGDRALAERMAESMGPLAILGGESVADVLGRLLKGTSVANALAPRNP
jgi:major vault protein